MRAEALPAPIAAAPDRPADLYLYALLGVLLGYVMLGKGFAYLGVPPL